jgi:hypothetical protein
MYAIMRILKTSINKHSLNIDSTFKNIYHFFQFSFKLNDKKVLNCTRI